MDFWGWFLRGGSRRKSAIDREDHAFEERRPGYTIFLDRWAFAHLAMGLILALCVTIPLEEAARAILLPLAGIFVGLSFAWGGNAVSLLQSEELDRLADFRTGGLREYIFKFQAAILTLLIALVLWGFAGLKLFEPLSGITPLDVLYLLIETVLYTIASVALRECWHVVLGAQSMLLLQRAIRKALKRKVEQHARQVSPEGAPSASPDEPSA